MIGWVAPCSDGTPSTFSVPVPMPSMRARPSPTRQRARSPISGSRAALAMVVWPFARLAAISRFSVAPTEANGSAINAPCKPPGAVALM